MNQKQREIELLAPGAGNWECARAAVANGADAIYFGMPKFNARLRADNFTEEDLPKLMEFLHEHGVRGFVAFNTLVFTHELEAAEEQLALLQECGVDAIIVQDIGLAGIAKKVAADVELHASTQMTITSPEGLEFVKELGLDRAVLARELSLRELERFKDSVVPLEVFVHGALCVAYSGQCLTSESLGQRSANRGECAQACRMPYELVVDGKVQPLGDRRYLLSPQDLAAVSEIPRLVELGVTSFKIEGRLKSPEYVAAVTQVYRRALDAAMAGKSNTSPTPAELYALEMTFSRGLFSGWMHGVNHQKLVGARYGKKRGALIGRVSSITSEGLALDEFKTPVKPGDGVVIDSGGDTNNEEGGFVYAVHGRELTFARGKVDWDRVRPGNLVWKTSDPALDKTLRHSFKGEIPRRPQHRISLSLQGSAGQPLAVHANILDGTPVSLTSETPLQPALKHPLTTAVLREQFGRLGGTGFELGEVDSTLPDGLMLPLSELGKLRRKLVECLSQQQKISRRPAIRGVVARELAEIAALRSHNPQTQATGEPQLSVLCRTQTQLESAAACGIARLYADFEDIRKYPDAVAWIRQNAPEAQLFLATPRIQKSGEQGFFKLIERAEPHGVLVRNLGAIAHFRDAGMPMVGDFSLNVANPLTARFFKNQGLEKLTVSYDLNIEQAVDLLEACPQEWFELTLHQHMPMFHMEHCVYAAFMSNGSTFLDCGRPCEKHNVTLRDRVGMEHPLRADVGCRNTLFNAVPQTAGRYFRQFMETGLRNYRIELLTEDAIGTAVLIKTYRSLFSGQVNGDLLWEKLKARSQYGVTGGTLRQL